MIQVRTLVDLIPTPREDIQIDELIVLLRDLDSVTKALQKDSVTLLECRVLFDAVIQKIPSTTSRLNPNADIVCSPQFESSIVKVLAGNISGLSGNEKESISNLVQRGVTEDPIINNAANSEAVLSFAEQISNKRKVLDSNSRYLDLRFLLPTTNIIERFFSKAGYTLDPRRRRVDPEKLEQQLFLHMNKEIWDITDVHEVVE